MALKGNQYKIHLLLAIVALLVLIAVNIWATYFVFNQLNSLTVLNNEVESAKNKLFQINETEKKINAQNQEIADLKNYFYTDIEFPKILNEIENLAKDNDLVSRVTYLNDNQNPGAVTVSLFTFGDFNKQISFYEKLFLMPYLIDVSMLEMEYGEIPSEYSDEETKIEAGWGVNYQVQIYGFLAEPVILVENTNQNENEIGN